MILRPLAPFALLYTAVQAFRDTSPFFLASTSELLTSAPSLIAGPTLQRFVGDELSSCPSDVYLLVSQPGVNAVDFHDRRAAPNLGRLAGGDDKSIRSSYTAQDVKGEVSSEYLKGLLEKKCDAQHVRQDVSTYSFDPAGSFSIGDESNPRVLSLEFPAPPAGNGRTAALAEHDEILGRVVDLLSSNKYTIIYTTTPTNAEPHQSHAEPDLYEMESVLHGHSHVELKRDLGVRKRDSSNETLQDGPLFERYQFLSPGIFMGLLAGIVLLSILYVGISGVSSLQITYAAFDKETGPAAQKNKAQ